MIPQFVRELPEAFRSSTCRETSTAS